MQGNILWVRSLRLIYLRSNEFNRRNCENENWRATFFSIKFDNYIIRPVRYWIQRKYKKKGWWALFLQRWVKSSVWGKKMVYKLRISKIIVSAQRALHNDTPRFSITDRILTVDQCFSSAPQRLKSKTKHNIFMIIHVIHRTVKVWEFYRLNRWKLELV